MSNWLIQVLVWPSFGLTGVLIGKGLHKSGDKVQLEMKAEGVFNPSDRRVNRFSVFRTETPMEQSFQRPMWGSPVAGGLRPLDLDMFDWSANGPPLDLGPLDWSIDGPYSTKTKPKRIRNTFLTMKSLEMMNMKKGFK